LSGPADSMRDAIETCERALRGEMLPHQVDAWELWGLLSKASDRLEEPEEYLLYASLLRLIVATVRLQCRWLRYEADELYVDSDLARERIAGLSTRTLNSIFLKSFHPIVEMEEMTARALEMGRDHWEELPGERVQEEIAADGLLTYGLGSEAGLMVLQEVTFDQLLAGLERELASEFGNDGGSLPYRDFLTRGGRADFAEMVTRSYLGSFLISQGRIALEADRSGLRLLRDGSDPSGRTQSLAIVLRRLKEGVAVAFPG
jgi:hypothetical protein